MCFVRLLCLFVRFPYVFVYYFRLCLYSCILCVIIVLCLLSYIFVSVCPYVFVCVSGDVA